MIKIFIKHKILEWCINVFFNAIHKNFIKTPNKFPKIGDYYKEIIGTDVGNMENHAFRECMITSIERKYFMDDNVVKLTFKHSGSDAEKMAYWADGEFIV